MKAIDAMKSIDIKIPQLLRPEKGHKQGSEKEW